MADNSSSGVLVAIVAILVIVIIGFFALRGMPGADAPAGTTGSSTLEVDVGGTGGGQ
jgi:hypothetical protein